ncbi:MAG: prolyl oligopeptidase family serine peptidase, partial [Clostridia bacterium]|nr:prolyl oligopeptidase family serine peptidase [Clostridia bacterium]
MSKKIISIVLAVLLVALPMTALAYDINTSPKLTYTNSDTTLPYRLILPENYDANKEYPMIVFFHGAGERGNDNELQFVHCVQYIHDNTPEPCIIVAPQCPTGNQWVDTPWSLGAYSVDKVPESNEMRAVIELLRSLETKYSVDSDRIYAMGISMGGFATWDAITRHSDYFAAAIPVCGGGDPSKADILKNIPIFTFHAINDPDVPVSGTQQTVKAIQQAGGSLISYTEYSYGAHGIWNMAFATEGLFTRLFACKLSDRAANAAKTNVALNKNYDAIELDTTYTAKLTDGASAAKLSYDNNWFVFKNNADAVQPMGGGNNAPDRVGTVVIDLEKNYELSEVSLKLVHNDQAGINIPARVTVYRSDDGEVWDNGTNLPIPSVS